MSSDAVCPRCRQEFSCNKEDVRQCFCARLALTPDQRQQIAQHYQGCLCRPCLAQLALEIE